MVLRIIQQPTIKRYIAKAFAATLSFHLRWTIKDIGWSYRVSSTRCPVCGSRCLEVYDEGNNRLIVEDVQPHDYYPGTVCDCAWLAPMPLIEDRDGENPIWVAQRTVEMIDRREGALINRGRLVGRSIRLAARS